MKRLGMQLLVLCVLVNVLCGCKPTVKQESVTPGPSANQLYVYQDKENQKSLWVPSGWMPDGKGIDFEDNFTKDCYEKSKTCMKIVFTANDATESWVGIYWLPLPSGGKTGSWKGPGINFYDKFGVKEGTPIKLTFWARGEDGDEQVNFKVGGVGDGDDSIAFAIDTGWKTLGEEWERYEIDLSGENLSNVVGGFCWVTNKDENPGKDEVWFYLDEIKYEW